MKRQRYKEINWSEIVYYDETTQKLTDNKKPLEPFIGSQGLNRIWGIHTP